MMTVPMRLCLMCTRLCEVVYIAINIEFFFFFFGDFMYLHLTTMYSCTFFKAA